MSLGSLKEAGSSRVGRKWSLSGSKAEVVDLVEPEQEATKCSNEVKL